MSPYGYLKICIFFVVGVAAVFLHLNKLFYPSCDVSPFVYLERAALLFVVAVLFVAVGVVVLATACSLEAALASATL